MSDESITHKEDKENLLYIARKIQLEEFTIGEEHLNFRDSLFEEEKDAFVSQLGSEESFLTKTTEALGPKVFRDSDILEKTRPFDLQWSFGVNTKVHIHSTSNKNEIFFASSHFPMLFNYCTRKMKHLEGHHNSIIHLSTDETGKWLVSADDGAEDGFLHIWDSEKCQQKSAPVFSLFSIYPNFGISKVKLSRTARYLLTIGSVTKDEYSVDYWLWTLGNDKPEDSFRISKSYGHPVAIRMNPDVEEHIMIIFTKQVFLLVWDSEAGKFSNPVIPNIMHKSRIGYLTGGTYLEKCHECFAASSKGCILIFGNTLYARPYEEGELDNSKIFRNAVKISPVSISFCRTTDGLLVTGDTRGYIFFFDKRIRILYWLRDFQLGPISSIVFSSSPKLKYQDADKLYIPNKQDHILECDFIDMIEEMEVLFQKDLPTDASLNKNPFVVRDFFVATADCNIYAVDCLNNKCTPLFHIADDCVAAIGAHDELNYIVIAYANGRITLVDYDKHEQIRSTILPVGEDQDGGKASISCIKYSIESFHLVCGRTNGEIWILDPILLTPVISEPFQITRNKVMKIEFSHVPIQFAYYDDDRTVVIFSYSSVNSQWECLGKMRPHYGDITDIMFIPGNPFSKLYTISKDRHLVDYNSSKIEFEEFFITSRERIEQSAIPMCFIYWVTSVQNKQLGYILVSDNKHKLKYLYQSSKVPKSSVQGPAYGCFKGQLIRKMMIIPHCESRYMAFSTDKHFGLHLLPPDGNPYKYVGYLAHPTGLQDFVLSNDGKYIFTFGINDHCVFKWKIISRSVEVMNLLGGEELEPFYCLIEGGYKGWLFQEIKDLFYYMQILQQENIDLPRRVSDSISISEIPDLFRTCGFYPSEFELENIMIDVRYRNMDETQNINEDINFIEFVKLFCNHKPVYGYPKKDLEKAFNVLAESSDEYYGDGTIDRDELIGMLTTLGESMTNSNVFKCFKTLMRVESSNESFDFLPTEIDFNTFFEDILGIDMDREKVLEGGTDSDNISQKDEDLEDEDREVELIV